MEEKKFEWLKGDRVLWILIICFSLVSVWLVFSASDNLQYIARQGTTLEHTGKHIIFILIGLGIMRSINLIEYKYIGGINYFVFPLVFILLLYASLSGQQVDGASAARWVPLPFGFSFQPSVFAYLALVIYLCRFLTKDMKKPRSWLYIIGLLYLPIYAVFGLVGKENGSTAVIIFVVCVVVMMIGQFPRKYIAGFIGGIAMVGMIFISLAKLGVIKNNRVDTWISRIEVFLGNEEKVKELGIDMEAKTYQVDRAKAAIYHGGWLGVGPGKSALKHSLPQSSSDFIFAIMVEEWGLIGACVLIIGYAIMMMRIVIIATRTASFFGALLVLSIGVMLFVQLAVHIAVSVNMFPVTGQPLPLISQGGTAMWMTFIQLGIVLNVSSQIQLRDEEGIGKKQSIEEINDIA